MRAILAARAQHRSWGQRKLKAWLERKQAGRKWPCASSIGAVLKRYGLTIPPKRRRRASPSQQPLAEARGANEIWAIDFKGRFRTGDGRRCDPLTLSDVQTRYMLRCQGVDETGGAFVRPLLEAAVREHGMAARMRSEAEASISDT